MELLELKKLVQKAKKNDEGAIEELYKLTIRKCTFLARKYLKDKSEADDVLQESYVKAFQKLDQLRDESKFESWLNMIVVRQCKNVLVKKHDIHFSDIGNEEYKAEDFIENENLDFSPKDNIDYQELKTAIKNILDELSVEQRMCIIMYYYQQYSIKEIAEILEVNENTIKSRLNYGKKKISEKILALEAKGYKIRGIAPIPFMVWALSQEESATKIPTLSIPIIQWVHESVKATERTAKHILLHGSKIKIATGVIAVTIVGGSYYVYDQAHTIDISENIICDIEGSNHYGTIRIKSNSIEYDGIETDKLISGYEFSKDSNLSNGDMVKIIVNYDEEYANNHSLKIKKAEKEIKIEGLSSRYENVNQIEKDKIQNIHACALNKVFQEKRKNDGQYKIITDENDTEREYMDYEYFEVVMSYLAKAEDNSLNDDKYIMLIRHVYRDSELDKEIIQKHQDIWGNTTSVYYADYHYIEVNNFYIESLNSNSEIEKNMSDIKDVEIVDMLKEKFAKEKFIKMIQNDNYHYDKVKDYINQYYL